MNEVDWNVNREANYFRNLALESKIQYNLGGCRSEAEDEDRSRATQLWGYDRV